MHAIIYVVFHHNSLPRINLLPKVNHTDISVKEVVMERTKWTKGVAANWPLSDALSGPRGKDSAEMSTVSIFDLCELKQFKVPMLPQQLIN